MKLPSIDRMGRDAVRSFLRFPSTILSAAVGSTVAVILIECSRDAECPSLFLWKILMAAALGIPLFTAGVILAERRRWQRAYRILLHGAVAVSLVLYYSSLPENVLAPPLVHAVRFWLFALAAHLLVALAVVRPGGSVRGFWNYNKSLFLRILTATLFSQILYAGLAVAILAVDKLFEVEIRGERYVQLWCIITGVFNTWFFLSGVPDDLEALDASEEYPKGLRVFTQYILLPLVVVYLVILYVYTGKILVEWEWPQGWVANLVLGFSVTGLFALLLIHPIRTLQEYRWIRPFSKGYYVALIPMVFLLLLSIWRRISEYGITENRYFVVALGVWLAAMVVYFILSKKEWIIMIPLSLMCATLLVSVGPWGAFSVSEQSQLTRLEELLRRNGILSEGRVRKAPSAVPFADGKEISSIVEYIYSIHGTEKLQRWFEQDLAALSNGPDGGGPALQRRVVPKKILALMGVEYVPEWRAVSASAHTFATQQKSRLDVRGYPHMFRDITLSASAETQALEGGRLQLDCNSSLLLFIPDSTAISDTLVVALQELLPRLLANHLHQPWDVPPDSMTIERAGPRTRMKVCLDRISIRREGERWEVREVAASVLLSHGTSH